MTSMWNKYLDKAYIREFLKAWHFQITLTFSLFYTTSIKIDEGSYLSIIFNNGTVLKFLP